MREGWERLRRWGEGLVWGSGRSGGGRGGAYIHGVYVVVGWCLLLWGAGDSGGRKWDGIWLRR